MNKKILMLTITLLAIAMLTTPVMAIGPEKAENNPNAVFVPWGVQLFLPSGVFNEWVTAAPVPVRVQILDASEFQIRNAFVVTNPLEVLGMENKWVYLTQENFAGLLVIFGFDPVDAAAIASEFPAGVYFRMWHVGK